MVTFHSYIISNGNQFYCIACCSVMEFLIRYLICDEKLDSWSHVFRQTASLFAHLKDRQFIECAIWKGYRQQPKQNPVQNSTSYIFIWEKYISAALGIFKILPNTALSIHWCNSLYFGCILCGNFVFDKCIISQIIFLHSNICFGIYPREMLLLYEKRIKWFYPEEFLFKYDKINI